MFNRSIFFILYICIAAAILTFSVQCSSNKQEPEKTAENTQHQWLNLHDSAKYVGMQTCRQCHEDKYQTFKETGMGQSWGKATMQKSAANFHQNQPIYDKFSDFYYKPFWKDSTLFVTEYRLQGRDTIHSRTEKLDYIVGSGQHTNSHIYNVNGYLYQAPFTYYVQKGQWDMPPGFENGFNTRFNRALGAECLTCHNGYPEFEKKSFNKYYKIPEGIDCERCHGPGSIHVNTKKQGEIVDIKHDTDFTIVNPRKLPYHLQIDVCQRCHLQGNTVLKEGKTFFDFKPGMQLSDVMDVFLPVYENQEQGFMMASHAERLRKSPCFLQTNKHGVESFNCITCHNPHVSVRTTKRQYFIDKCMACHKQPHEKSPQILQTKNQDCISCHMPKSSAVDIPHVTITDHFIRVVDKRKQGTTVG
ncbi:MAG: pilus assembly protein TadD, partial [Sphingobacteriales bacterium]